MPGNLVNFVSFHLTGKKSKPSTPFFVSIGFYNWLQVSIYGFLLTTRFPSKVIEIRHLQASDRSQVGVFERREGAADSLYGAFFDAAPNLQGMFRVRGGAAMGDRENVEKIGLRSLEEFHSWE